MLDFFDKLSMIFEDEKEPFDLTSAIDDIKGFILDIIETRARNVGINDYKSLFQPSNLVFEKNSGTRKEWHEFIQHLTSLAKRKYQWTPEASELIGGKRGEGVKSETDKAIEKMEDTILNWLYNIVNESRENGGMPNDIKYPRRIRAPLKKRERIVKTTFGSYIKNLRHELETNEEIKQGKQDPLIVSKGEGEYGVDDKGRPLGKFETIRSKHRDPTEKEIIQYLEEMKKYLNKVNWWGGLTKQKQDSQIDKKPTHPRKKGKKLDNLTVSIMRMLIVREKAFSRLKKELSNWDLKSGDFPHDKIQELSDEYGWEKYSEHESIISRIADGVVDIKELEGIMNQVREKHARESEHQEGLKEDLRMIFGLILG